MEFKHEELLEREKEIARYLAQDLSLKRISEKTGLSKKLLVAHIKNLMEKLKAGDMHELIGRISEFPGL